MYKQSDQQPIQDSRKLSAYDQDNKQRKTVRNEVVREGLMENWELAQAFRCMDGDEQWGRTNSKYKRLT